MSVSGQFDSLRFDIEFPYSGKFLPPSLNINVLDTILLEQVIRFYYFSKNTFFDVK